MTISTPGVRILMIVLVPRSVLNYQIFENFSEHCRKVVNDARAWNEIARVTLTGCYSVFEKLNQQYETLLRNTVARYLLICGRVKARH